MEGFEPFKICPYMALIFGVTDCQCKRKLCEFWDENFQFCQLKN